MGKLPTMGLKLAETVSLLVPKWEALCDATCHDHVKTTGSQWREYVP